MILQMFGMLCGLLLVALVPIWVLNKTDFICKPSSVAKRRALTDAIPSFSERHSVEFV